MVLEKIKNRIIAPDNSILSAMKKMDEIKMKILFIYADGKFEGILTLGDIQRAIIKGYPLTEEVGKILDNNKIYADVDESIDSIKEKMESIRAELMPVLKGDELVDVYTWENLFGKSSELHKELIDLPVVIMAGGKGTRIASVKSDVPKPMIPICGKPILEW